MFFFFGNKPSDKPENYVYYAYVNSIEETENSVFLELDSIGQKWAEKNILRDGFNFLEQEVPEIRSSLILLQTDRVRFSEWIEIPAGNLKENLESTWLRIELSNSENDIEANYFSENADYTFLPITVRLKKGKKIHNDSDGKLLQQNINLNELKSKCEQTKDKIEEFIHSQYSHENNRAEFVSAYGVGQGSANAICNIFGEPLMYFDIGGGFGWNWFTYNQTKRFEVAKNRIAFLSHWDTDHFESATRSVNRDLISYMKWIAPFQDNLGARHLNFALKLYRNGNLILVDDITPEINTPFGSLLKCTGNDRNNSGFAFDVSLSPEKNTLKRVLLPGDASYSHVSRSIENESYHVILATHHGANFNAPNIVPQPLAKKGIVYSYGIGNTYQHPRLKTAIMDHINGGWITRKDISNTNIGIHDIESYDQRLCWRCLFHEHYPDMCLHQSFR